MGNTNAQGLKKRVKTINRCSIAGLSVDLMNLAKVLKKDFKWHLFDISEIREQFVLTVMEMPSH